jgi:hydroxymethylbilane synthase
MRIRIGTRGSKLALAQASLVRQMLTQACPNIECRAVVITTAGDREAESGGPIAGTGIFVKEIEEQLLGGGIDVAVHSLKDMPVAMRPGAILAAVLPREDPREAFVSRDGRRLFALPCGARVATGSLRRQAQLLRRHPGLQFIPIRGNVDTRLRKIREGAAEGIVLALAGLRRLGLESSVTDIIPFEECLPAPGQGAVVCELRAGEAGLQELVGRINHAASARAVEAERSFLAALGGGCRTPIAAYACEREETLELRGFVGESSGLRYLEGMAAGIALEPNALGEKLARDLLAQGAGELLAL